MRQCYCDHDFDTLNVVPIIPLSISFAFHSCFLTRLRYCEMLRCG
jgi:hypothetical protein